MATANNTIKTRIQLKSDTEANWNKAGPKENSNGFIPLNGELIIYSADNAHPFSRLKIGDGVTNVVDLPFVDAGTLNGSDMTSQIPVSVISEWRSGTSTSATLLNNNILKISNGTAPALYYHSTSVLNSGVNNS